MSAGPHIEQRKVCNSGLCGDGARLCEQVGDEPCPAELYVRCCTSFAAHTSPGQERNAIRVHDDEMSARLTLANHLADEHGMTVNPAALPIIPREDT